MSYLTSSHPVNSNTAAKYLRFLIPITFMFFGLLIGFVIGLGVVPFLFRKNIDPIQPENNIQNTLSPMALYDDLQNQVITDIKQISIENRVIHIKKRISTTQQQPIGIEHIGNQVKVYDQTKVVSARLNSTGFVQAWLSVGYGGLPTNIVGRIFNEDGTACSDDILIGSNAGDTTNDGTNDVENNGQYAPSITALEEGFGVAWLIPYSGGRAQQVAMKIFNSQGKQINNQTIVSPFFPTVNREEPHIIPGFVAYTSVGQSTFGLPTNPGYPNAFGQSYTCNSSTLALINSEVRLDSGAPPANAEVKGLTSLIDGTSLSVWFQTDNPGVNQTLVCYGQQLNASSGAPIGSKFLLHNTTTASMVNVKIDKFSNFNQGFVVVLDGRISTNNYGVFAKAFISPSNSWGDQTEVNINTYASLGQTNPRLVVLNDDSVMAVWQNFGRDGSYNGIFARHFKYDSNGMVEFIGREFLVNWLNTHGNQQNPRIIQLTNGNIVISYESYSPSVDPVSGLPLGFDIKHQVLTPRLDPFIYNTDIPLTLDQNAAQNGTNFVLNPMVDADTVTVTLTPSTGINLSTVNTTSYSYGNAAVIKDADTGEISISGHAVPVNLALNQLTITPTNYFSGDASIAIHATDGGLHADFNATVSVDVVLVAYKPDLTAATQIDIYQNIPFTLTSNLFNASNPDTNVHRPIAYDIGSALRITFFNTTTSPAEQVISFTDEELSNGVIEARPDDSGLSPSFTLQARDRVTSLTSAVTSVTVAFTARPVLELGAFAISSDEVFTFTTDNLKTNAGVYPVNSVWQFSAIQNAQIINPKTNTKWPVDENGSVTVTQDALVNGLVGIKPNGKSTSPAFNVAFGIPTNVPGQNLYSRTSAAQINFNYVAKDNKALIGGVVGGVGGLIALSALGIGIFACVKKNKKEQALLDKQEASRQNEPLANAVWEKLGSPEDYADFTSEAGLAFVAAINKIAAKMNQQLSYKDNYIYFAEKFVEAMNQHQITADHISDNIPKISSYINKNWDEAKAVQAQEESKITANREYEVELTPV